MARTFFVGRALGLGVLAIVVAVIGGFYWLNSYIYNEKQAENVADYKNATYVIENSPVTLHDGVAETEIAPGSASKVTTRYFGNELKTDLNGDGREDVAFILTQTSGGSGTFYYAVAALNTLHGYVGSDGYLLGDRIAPQSTNVSQNPNQQYVVVFNYADRAPTEPMTAEPSVGKSIYLKLDPETVRWGIVEPNFEGESDGVPRTSQGIHGRTLLGPTCPVMRDPPDPQCADRPYKTSLVITTADQTRVVKTFSTDESGKFSVEIPPGEYAIRSAAAANILPYCQSGTFRVQTNTFTDVSVSCDTGIR